MGVRGWKRGLGRPPRRAGADRDVLRSGRSPALTPALRAGEPPKRRLRAAVIFIGPETPRLPEGLAAGVNARPTICREKVPKPGTDAGKMSLAAERCFYPTCRLPCIVGRAISPAGQHSGKRKAAGKVNVPPSIAVAGSFAGRCEHRPLRRVLPAGLCCVGADGFHRPGNAAAAGRSRGERERPPYALPQMGAGKKTSAAKAKFPVSPAVCLAL